MGRSVGSRGNPTLSPSTRGEVPCHATSPTPASARPVTQFECEEALDLASSRRRRIRLVSEQSVDVQFGLLCLAPSRPFLPFVNTYLRVPTGRLWTVRVTRVELQTATNSGIRLSAADTLSFDTPPGSASQHQHRRSSRAV